MSEIIDKLKAVKKSKLHRPEIRSVFVIHQFHLKVSPEQMANDNVLGSTCAFYLCSLLQDSSNPELTEKFVSLLCKWGVVLEKNNKIGKLFDIYKTVIRLFPDNVAVLNNFGSHLFRLGLINEASFYFRKCLTIDPHFLRATHNLNEILLSSVERWHFKMLNDQQRNEGFREAIIKKINQGFDRVLDVGTGTGLLSLCCFDGKAREIYACDSSPVMTEIAKQVFLSNNATNIKLIQKESFKLQIPEDISEKVSLLVTETFDVGLLGEHVLLILAHAWKYLLLPPPCQSGGLTSDKVGAVIPHRATVYATGIEFDEVANDLHLKQKINSSLFENCNVLQWCEYYDSQDLSRARFKCLTETEKIFEINFNDPIALENCLKGWHKNMTLKYKCSGRLDCFALWFDLYLDEDIVLSTCPHSKASAAWDQAIFLLPRSTLVRENQNLNVTIAFENSKLNINLNDVNIEGPKFVVSERVIGILNDEKLAEGFHQLANKLSSEFNDSISVLDCYSFPVFGVNFLKNRSNKFKDELWCIVSTEDDRLLINFMAMKHGVEIKTIVKKKDNFLPYSASVKSFDVILLDLFESSGEIKDECLLDTLKSYLKPGGIILPQHVTVIGQFIYSDWLTTVSKVLNDSVTCGYNIAEHINKYQVQDFIDFYFKSLDYNSIYSSPIELFNLFDSDESVTEMIIPCQSGAALANAMVYWYKIKFTEDCDELLTKDITYYHQAAFVFSKIESREIKFNIIRNDNLFCIKLLND